MRPILVSQRVEVAGPHGERRDALAQDWPRFLAAAGLLAVAVPNDLAAAQAIAAGLPWHGLLLTGGNDLVSLGGNAGERDAVESWLLEEALGCDRPVLGVCRGMQVLLQRFGARLVPVRGHAGHAHSIVCSGRERSVNSYHRYGSTSVSDPLETWAQAPDGVVEGIRHRALPLVGIMWHPERLAPAHKDDLTLFARHFGSGPADGRGSASCAG
ncbi:MAG: gamma-glutamyl-gamma-aminobutyrate hydrolase [Planctomycetaceae bacterium]|nr:gamma-glutamyl-gamma-aminobutyrate hydrolase [Planctomycetaceae bacterium]